MASIDATYRASLQGVPPRLGLLAATLPHRLGLTLNHEGGFDAFILLDVNRDLVRYAAEDPASPGRSLLSDERLARYRAAHHLAIVVDLLTDRIEDGQASRDARLSRLRRTLLRRCHAALAEATGDGTLARRAVVDALAQQRRGAGEERAALASRTLTPARYAQAVRQKSRIWGMTARALLEASGAPARARALGDVYDAFLFALQCRDDAEDHEEDLAVRGASFPAALGVPAAALARAAIVVVAAAVPRAEAAGFHELDAFLQRWLAAIAPSGRPVEPAIERAAAIVAEAWEAQAITPPRPDR